MKSCEGGRETGGETGGEGVRRLGTSPPLISRSKCFGRPPGNHRVNPEKAPWHDTEWAPRLTHDLVVYVERALRQRPVVCVFSCLSFEQTDQHCPTDH